MPHTSQSGLYAALFGIMSILASCDRAPEVSGPVALASRMLVDGGLIPTRASEKRNALSWNIAADSDLWTAGARSDSVFTVGLKAPGAVRGVYHGVLLLDHLEWKGALQQLAHHPGIQLVRVDTTILPWAAAKIANSGSLSAIRRLPFVDYVEPYRVQITSASSGCGPEYLTTYIRYVTASNGGQDGYATILENLAVNKAWSYSTGRGVTIGLTDQGIDDTPGSDFNNANFSSVDSYGRTYYQERLNTQQDVFSVCDHGTRMGNLMAAPRNGRGVVGVAYGANVFSDYFTDSPVIWGTQEGDVMVAIDQAYYYGSRVTVLAWGMTSWSNLISDIIDQDYYVHDVLFVGAAGTCWDGTNLCPNMGSAVFPAEKGEVLAATGLTWYGGRPTDNFDFGAKYQGVVAYTFLATVLSQAEGGGIGQLNGSSAATAVVGGISALVRSRYPSMTNAQVVDRLISTSDGLCQDPPPTWRTNVVNALAAVGGPCVRRIHGPTQVTVYNQPNSSVSATYLIDPPTGDNPLSISWLTGDTGLSTIVRWGADGYYGTQTHPVLVWITDATTGVTVRRSLDVQVTTANPNGSCTPGTFC